MRTLEELDAKAYALYEKSVEDRTINAGKAFFEEFTLRELAYLWEFKCVYTKENTWGVAYDDEVYEALDAYNNMDTWKMKQLIEEEEWREYEAEQEREALEYEMKKNAMLETSISADDIELQLN